MSPLSGPHLDVEAVSGILGSISIACWVVVFTPQIVENFRRSSADGLSLTFLLVWLIGDIFNIVGAVLQGVLPTMIILAVYYTLADIVLLLQCFYYRGFSLSDDLSPSKSTAQDGEPNENAPLLSPPDRPRAMSPVRRAALERSLSNYSNYSSYSGVDGTHLSPATPLLTASDDPPAARNFRPMSTLQSIIFNTLALVLVCAAGAFGWWLSAAPRRHGRDHGHYDANSGGGGGGSDGSEEMGFDVLGQVFGYLCAVFYLGSRLPQLLLNYRRKSTEGVSILFFLFACVGNLTYVMSILAFDPICGNHRSEHGHDDDNYASSILFGRGSRHNHCREGEWWDRYGWYMLVNLSWLIGSAGTLVMDFAIFGQFWLYKGMDPIQPGDHHETSRENAN